MTFKNLEERFNARVNELYKPATNKFENGKRSTSRTAQPFIVRIPGEGQRNISLDSRGTPIVSGPTDVQRLTLFQISSAGLKFLAKQQVLQTGNTFEQTRLVNPTFVVANGIPFLHVKRNLRPLGELLRKTDTSESNVRLMGELQVGTYNQMKNNFNTRTPVFYQEMDRYFSAPRFSANLNRRDRFFQALKTFGTTVLSPILNTISGFTAKRNIADKVGFKFGNTADNNLKKWGQLRPEIESISNKYNVKSAITWQQKTAADLTILSSETINVNNIPFLKYFRVDEQGNQSIKKSSEGTLIDGVQTFNAVVKAGGNPAQKLYSSGTRIKYLKDASNTVSKTANTKISKPYQKIDSKFEDIINVSFAMGNEDPVRFRAFLTGLQETTTPQYKPHNYIGRIETFYTYSTVKRSVQFKLGIVAFSKDELPVVWKRLNFLTGLAYPYGFNNGLLQPNILRFTIGDVYVNQPAIIEGAINVTFNELAESWEIDKGKQVPIAASVAMTLTLIEKYTRVATSPFYGITEKMTDEFTNKLSSLPTPPQNTNSQMVPPPVQVLPAPSLG